MIANSRPTKWVLMGLLVVGMLTAVGLLSWTLSLGDRSERVSTGQPFWVIDRSNDRELVGLAQDVFFGRVVEKSGQTQEYGWPETQFEVEVLEILKGSLSGTVTVNQEGGSYNDDSNYRMEGVPVLLEPGNSYLFATRHLPEEDWHTVVPGFGSIKLGIPLNIGKDEILGSEDVNILRERFTTAVNNQIPYDPLR